MAKINPGYLIPQLRLTIGDITPSSYRYTTEWLKVAISASITSLARWWNNKYLLDSDDLVYRNTTITFPDEEPPIIMPDDERPIVLMAAIIILEGSLENSAWNFGSWRDNEVAYSNIESGRIRDNNVNRLWQELTSIMTPPTKTLARPVKGTLPGYKNNLWEKTEEF